MRTGLYRCIIRPHWTGSRDLQVALKAEPISHLRRRRFVQLAGTATETQSLRDAGRFLVTFALTTGFFALDMALFQPRYLGLFPRMLHPHLP
jgi:hypothetical protein